MRFADPWFLLLLLLLPVLAWLKGRRGGRAAFLYSAVSLVKGIRDVSRTRVGVLLLRMRWLALGLLVVGFARPQRGLGVAPFQAAGIDIMVALDLSSSMISEDFHWQGHRANRLFIAKQVLKSFVKKRSSDRIGLIAFGGRPYVASPPTLDHDFLLANIDRLHIGSVEDGTAIGSAIAAALNQLRDLKSKTKVIILMTDGQNNAGNVPPLTAADAAQALGVKIYTIGVGKHGMAPVPYVDPFGNKRYREVPVNIDEATLRQIAQRTGGAYFRADSTDTLRQIYNRIDHLEKTKVEVKRYERYEELFPWLVLPGLALLLLEIILGNTVWRTLP